MKRKITNLMWALASLIAVSQAFAQSSHDIVSGTDADFIGNTSKFDIASPDGKFRLEFAGHLQQRNEFTYNPESKEKDLQISIPRARLKLLGNAFDPSITYLLQVQFENAYVNQKAGLIPGTTQYGVPGSTGLRDYYVNAAIDPDYFHVRIGKFRTPFSRQQLISSSQMQFHNQNSANNYFQLTQDGHDIGLMLHNGFNNSFEWALAAVSNGVVARIGYNHGGIDAYDFADFAGGGFRFAIAANGFAQYDYKSTEFQRDIRGGADFIVKYEGFSTNGAFYYRHFNNRHELGGSLDLGILIGQNWEPVLRYSWLKPDEENLQEGRFGINYYFYGHHLKLLTYVGPDLVDKKIINWQGGTQFQFAL